MKLYKSKPRYDINTGKEISPVLTACGIICDYEGLPIDIDDGDAKPCYTISIEYDQSSEPLWYEDPERQFLENEYEVEYGEYGEFMSSPYHFGAIECHGVSDVSVYLVEEWLKERKSKKSSSPFRDCNTIEQAFHAARLRTLMKLLKEGNYTPLQLGFLK